MGKNINRVVTAPEEGLGANAYLFIQYKSNDSKKSFNSSSALLGLKTQIRLNVGVYKKSLPVIWLLQCGGAGRRLANQERVLAVAMAILSSHWSDPQPRPGIGQRREAGEVIAIFPLMDISWKNLS